MEKALKDLEQGHDMIKITFQDHSCYHIENGREGDTGLDKKPMWYSRGEKIKIVFKMVAMETESRMTQNNLLIRYVWRGGGGETKNDPND